LKNSLSRKSGRVQKALSVEVKKRSKTTLFGKNPEGVKTLMEKDIGCPRSRV
jgi:hypothetical protein